MNHIKKQTPKIQHGSVYLITLITVAAISSMVLIGVSIRANTNTQSTLIEQMAASSNATLDATEYALQAIASDPMWVQTAQSGTAFSPFTINDTTYTGTVTDAGTDAIPTDSTTTYRLKVAASSNLVSETAQIDVLTEKMDYCKFLADLSAHHYWPLNETGNPVEAIDQKGSADGTYLVPSIAGKAINDEGANVPLFKGASTRIEIPWEGSFTLKTGSFATWVKIDGSKGVSGYYVAGINLENTAAWPSFSVYIASGALVALLNDNGDKGSTGSYVFTSSGLISKNSWHHIAVTWSKTELKSYVDGVLEANYPNNGDGIVKLGAVQPVLIGAGFLFTPTGTIHGHAGSIAHTAFFKNVLTDAEVASIAAIKPDQISLSLVNDSWVRVYED